LDKAITASNEVPLPLVGRGRGGGLAVANRFARTLRANATDAERILWRQLRLLKAEGRHFRRQVPLSGFIADFACHSAGIVIELDGGQHGEAVEYDKARTAVLSYQGYKVLRFWNSEVFEALEGVLDRIRHEVGLPTAYVYSVVTPTPTPPHKGEGDQD
jgi:very-short-patch-repair endonuclease